MTDNEARACYVHWRDIAVQDYNHREFVICWSDHTWEIIEIPDCGWQIGGKTVKQHMGLNKMVSSKMTKEEAKRYISRKVAEMVEMVEA